MAPTNLMLRGYAVTRLRIWYCINKFTLDSTEIYRCQSYQTFFKLVNAYLSENRYLASQISSLLSMGAENQKRL